MKISEMSAKTSIEVSDDDFLVIEDTDGTKRITAKELRTFLMQNDGVENTVKQYFNQGIDKIIAALNDAKLTVRTEKKYNVTTIIKNENQGNSDFSHIEFAFYDCDNNIWLTKTDIENLVTIDIDEEAQEPITRNFIFKVEVTASDGTESTKVFSSEERDIIEVPTKASSENSYDYPEELYFIDDKETDNPKNAGLIKVHFVGLQGEQNMVNSITANRIYICLPQDENYKYTFICDKINNEVSYKAPSVVVP